MKVGYGINHKYEGMLTHLFDRFYVVTKFILPTMDDLKLSEIRYDKESKHPSNLDDNDDKQIKINIKDLITYCAKLRSYMDFYKMQINVHNRTAHHILKNEVHQILPGFLKVEKLREEFLA